MHLQYTFPVNIQRLENKKFARVIQSQTSGNISATGLYGTLRSGGETNVLGRSPQLRA